MVIVDTHCHASRHWFEPVELLLFQMNSNGVDRAALIQLDREYDNSYIFECARSHPDRFTPVVIVDHERDDAPQTLTKLVAEGAAGVRLRPAHRSPGKDPLAIWKACNALGLPVSVAGREHEFASDEFRSVVQAVPDIPLILEHLAHVVPDQPPPYDNFRKALQISRFSNVYIKVGGLAEICKRPYPARHPFHAGQEIPPFIKMVYETFGPQRMMWGSNYPPVSGKEGYANALNLPLEHLASFCSEADREWIMGRTALSVFKFSSQ